MQIFQKVSDLKKEISKCKAVGKSIGFVPTMGYLHKGHLSLVKAAKKDTDIVVVSIFVNPTQFGLNEDLKKYPRDIEKDTKLLEKENTDILFYPTQEEIYPPEVNIEYVEVPELGQKLCGKSRPIHFRGVTTVVKKLFDMVGPDKAFFGKKDRQQLIIIKKMVELLRIPIEIIGCPIIREPDGLALSSRNTYLNEEQRRAALLLSKSLKIAKELITNPRSQAPNPKMIIKDMRALIEKEPLAKIDYVEIVDTDKLDPVKTVKKGDLIALAVYIGKTRLIDNWIVGE